MHLLRCFLQCERGATAIEYALIAGFVSIAIVAGATAIGQPLSNVFLSVANAFK